ARFVRLGAPGLLLFLRPLLGLTHLVAVAAALPNGLVLRPLLLLILSDLLLAPLLGATALSHSGFIALGPFARTCGGTFRSTRPPLRHSFVGSASRRLGHSASR